MEFQRVKQLSLATKYAEYLKNLETTGGGNRFNVDIFSDLGENLGEKKYSDWTNFSESIGAADAYLSYIDKNINIINEMRSSINEDGYLPEQVAPTATKLVIAASEIGKPELMKVTMLATSRDGKPMQGLVFKCMSKVAHELMHCDLKHGIPFATSSYEATQSMRRAEWYIWAENPRTKEVTKPQLSDLTKFATTEHRTEFYIEWE